MKWRGETEAQQKARLSKWHRHFCLVPCQVEDGSWVWLQWVWAKLDRTVGGSTYFRFSDSENAPEEVPFGRPPNPPRR